LVSRSSRVLFDISDVNARVVELAIRSLVGFKEFQGFV